MFIYTGEVYEHEYFKYIRNILYIPMSIYAKAIQIIYLSNHRNPIKYDELLSIYFIRYTHTAYTDDEYNENLFITLNHKVN